MSRDKNDHFEQGILGYEKNYTHMSSKFIYTEQIHTYIEYI